jgi:hypothetical protein
MEKYNYAIALTDEEVEAYFLSKQITISETLFEFLPSNVFEFYDINYLKRI